MGNALNKSSSEDRDQGNGREVKYNVFHVGTWALVSHQGEDSLYPLNGCLLCKREPYVIVDAMGWGYADIDGRYSL